MSGPEHNVALFSSLRSLVRGLTALFWGVPATLVIAFQTGKGDWLQPLGCFPVLLATTFLLYGVLMLGAFQTQERIWITALERARLVAIANIGLSPFLYFWSRLPANGFFTLSVEVLFVTLLSFLYLLNSVLARLAAMLPDETLRGETRLFTRLNQGILLTLMVSAPFYFLLRGAETLPRIVVDWLLYFERGGEMLQVFMLLIFILLPVAMTMALLWKTKEAILDSVFASHGAEGSRSDTGPR